MSPGPAASARQLDFDSCYRAVQSRDARFDGQFFVAVRTTGIYCRPSCPAITPKPHNVSFVLTAAVAQQEGYRACRRCLPDAVPGSPRWNVNSDLASRAMRLIEDGLVDRTGVSGLAGQLGYSPRQLNRVLGDQIGAGPLALARAYRATTARMLIQCTDMSMSDIAFAAGFASIRQFNDTVREVFAQTPTELRAKGAPRGPGVAGAAVTLKLAVRQPFSPPWLHWFLSAHAVTGIESWDGQTYRRSLDLPHGPAIVGLQIDTDHVRAELRLQDMRDLGVAVHRVRKLLDLDADVAAANDVLQRVPALSPLVDAMPGIRAPGSIDPTELLLRTMIGQQISLPAARTHAAKLVAALGVPLGNPDGGITHLFPTAAAIAERGHEVLTGPAARTTAIVDVSRAIAEDRLTMHPGLPAAELRTQLIAQRGIGAWTADYVIMRLLGDPDILLNTDLVLRKSAADLDIDLTDTSRWSPWRSYASMHLWRSAVARVEPTLAVAPAPPITTRSRKKVS
ncbi:AlkA N-terminal domain-containing protein [Williamsia sp. 1135]|uniref:AlkA N-terminal domain-containing protein n=1 Tax=Williamsia sp. 1135 TaxID=1889262 RepID=UPI000A0F4631|nr:AlkA N-terminal domain-containing protein [Williamsia sp. 1135]ORM36884.1 DNA-3-methyladenine glycosylase [Williamsia sp. 1135]